MIKTRWLKFFSVRRRIVFKSRSKFSRETVDRSEYSGEPKLCNRIDTWKTVNRILGKGRWVETANPQDRSPNQAKEAL